MIPCILSADDDKVGALNNHRGIMKQYGFQIRQTTQLKRIPEMIRKYDVDCIHLDIVFDSDVFEPDWTKPNGLSVVGEIVQECKNVPVMVISGYIDEKAKQMAEKYGLKDIIYKWYSKPVDYDTIALDSIKAINEFKLKRSKDNLCSYLNRLGNKKDRKKKNQTKEALKIIDVFPGGIELKPNHLLDKLEKLSYKILANLKPSSISLDNEDQTNLEPPNIDHFKELLEDHLYEYLKSVSLKHAALAEHLLTAISDADDCYIKTERTFKFVLCLLEKFRKRNLSEKEVYETRIELEKTLNVRLYSMGSKDNVYKYLKAIKEGE